MDARRSGEADQVTRIIIIIAIVGAGLLLPPRIRITTSIPKTAICRSTQ